MAKKIEKQQPDTDLEILHPDQQLTLGKRLITIHEYGFVEGLKLRPLMRPFLDDLHKLALIGGEMPLDEVFDLIALHLDTVLTLVAAATDLERKEIEALSDSHGDTLLMTWWTVNGPFFIRQLQKRLLSDTMQAIKQTSVRSAGVTSMPNSSQQDTMQTESEAIPSDS